MKHLYFDYNATTPVHPDVRDRMAPYLSENFGNPGCPHLPGLLAKEAVAEARSHVAALLGVEPENVVFTSGATEANNIAVMGTVGPFAPKGHPTRIAVSAVEHPAVFEPARALQRIGAKMYVLPVDSTGVLDLASLEKVCAANGPGLLAVMLANNETGTLNPVREAAAIAKEHGWLVHCDAAQAVGKIPVDVRELGVDYLAVAGHKFYAPKGAGALIVASEEARRSIGPVAFGGGQEQRLRPGTENVPYIVALGAAAQIAGRDVAAEAERQKRFGLRLMEGIDDLGISSMVLGKPLLHEERLPQTANVGFENLKAGDILSGLVAREVAVSGGAACHAGQMSISITLLAMNAPERFAAGAIRFSWGRFTQESDVDELLERLEDTLSELG
ncbi:MAG: cysteine desulfurase family protein [Oceanidesulfovibrio sp.]